MLSAQPLIANFSHILETYPVISALCITIAIWSILSIAIYYCTKYQNFMQSPLRFLRGLGLPTLLLLWFVISYLHVGYESRTTRLIETLLGIEVIWFLLILTKVVFFHHPATTKLRSTVPGLFFDLVSLSLVIVGSALMIAAIWDRDLTNVLTTLGIGSIVIGLALQDTLGNLFSGIALLFEKPFQLSDWVQIGDTVGEVIGTNWRAVRLQTRDLDMVVVPNSSLTKERIKNFSRPRLVHREILTIGFSYQDSPHRVQEAMLEVLRSTPGVLLVPEPRVRTKTFHDYSIIYELLLYTEDYKAVQDISADIMTRAWYAAQRHGLTIPFPTRTVYKTEVSPSAPITEPKEAIGELLHKVPLLSPLSDLDIDWLAARIDVHSFSDREHVIRQGEQGRAMYVIQHGEAIVLASDERGVRSEVARLSRGDMFGERSLFRSEPRAASVIASGELTVAVIPHSLFRELLDARPDISEHIENYIRQREEELQRAMETSQMQEISTEAILEKTSVLKKLKGILGI